MSRVIKFQAFIPDLKIIIPEVYPCGDDMIGLAADKLEELIKGKFQIYDDEIYDLSEDFNKIMSILCGDEWYWLEKGDYELRQYTGLKDIAGIEIYEGDIFQVAGNRKYEIRYCEGGISNHEWHGGSFVLWLNEEAFFPFDEFAIKNGKVIGNIYESLSALEPSDQDGV